MPRRKTEAEKEAARVAKEEEKQRKADARLAERERKLAEKEAEKQSKALAREAEKQRKLKQKQAEKEANAKEREDQRKAKQAAKEAEKEAKRKEKEGAEPKVKWKKSIAKQMLYKDIREGRVPLESKDADGKATMNLKDIYEMHPEYAEYHYDKFSSRLSSLRKTIKDCNHRAGLDQEAFDNYKKNHPNASFYSHKGYIQWQNSAAQAQAQIDIAAGLQRHGEDLWSSNSVYYKNFPLDVWRDKMAQEVRTKKYLHTLEVKGRDLRKKKLVDVKNDKHTKNK